MRVAETQTPTPVHSLRLSLSLPSFPLALEWPSLSFIRLFLPLFTFFFIIEVEKKGKCARALVYGHKIHVASLKNEH